MSASGNETAGGAAAALVRATSWHWLARAHRVGRGALAGWVSPFRARRDSWRRDERSLLGDERGSRRKFASLSTLSIGFALPAASGGTAVAGVEGEGCSCVPTCRSDRHRPWRLGACCS